MKANIPPIAAKGAKRRSTRVAQAVPLVVTWTGAQSKKLLEETATLSINCHGCQYFSQFRVRKNTKITVQVGAAQKELATPPEHFPARVAWVRKSRRLGGMYQIGVEFDTPQNVWHVDQEPEDWRSFTSSSKKDDSVSLLTEMERLLQFAHAGTYYQLLGVQPDTSPSELKRHFYHLASRFHPDHHMDRPEWTPRLLVLMDSLTTGYKTLSDETSKKQYDSRLNPEPRRESSERGQSARECLKNARECLAEKNYIGSILWFRRVIEIEPESSAYRAMLGQSLAAVPEYRREAAEQFERAIHLDPTCIAAHFQYAQLLEQVKLPWRARHHYLRVLELDAKHGEARKRIHHLNASTPRHSSRPSLLSRLTGRR